MVKYSKIYQFPKGVRTPVNAFSTEEFMLDTEYARALYRRYAEHMPIICFDSPFSRSEIIENKAFSNITELWIRSDRRRRHAMRACGCEEKYITGDASDYDKFREYCRVMPKLVGSPVYFLSHLELQKHFDCRLAVCPQNCERIWNVTAERLSYGGMRVKDLLKRSNVKALCVELDPCDEPAPFELIPVFSPDRGLCVERKGIKKYIERLGEHSGVKITALADLERAYTALLDDFVSAGCRVAHHSADVLSNPHFPDPYHADLILKKALASDGADITPDEAGLFKCQMLRFLGIEYKKRGIVMRLCPDRADEYKASTLPRLGENRRLGASYDGCRAKDLASLLGYLYQNDAMPKTLVCMSSPAQMDDLTRFGSHSYLENIYFKLNCHLEDMPSRLSEYANHLALGTLCGITVDSEPTSLFSEYEYFRRALCSLVGGLCERGLCPWDEISLGELIEDILYRNEAKLLGI